MRVPSHHRVVLVLVVGLVGAVLDAGIVCPRLLGAETSLHWAFLPLRVADLTSPASTGAATSPIDCWVEAAWQVHGLVPNSVASQTERLRRLSYDLRGLPPTVEEIAHFNRDERPDAWKRQVEQWLASPHYGERWGRYWMDVIRYADTAGDNADYPIPELQSYRDYIIDAFNTDKPYDQFVREQIAGDLYARREPNRHDERAIATGFLALSRRYGTSPYEHWHLTLEDSIDTVGRAFLGMTFKCARCHDHKFDPMTTEEYYGLYGIFASTQYPWGGGEEFQSKHLSRQHFVALAHEPELAAARSVQMEQEASLEARIATAASDEVKQALQQQLQVLRRPGLPSGIRGVYAVQEGDLVHAPVHVQGEPAILGDMVPRAVPQFLDIQRPVIPDQESGRRQLAAWITSPDNPLFARVMVNRIWQHHFGVGLVSTPSNFGLRGSPPTHPVLLDYLARVFIESEYSVKTIQRLILQSRTYQLSSADHSANRQVDPNNEYLWRHARRRLDAEALRDTILATAGQLDVSRPGSHPFPDIADWHWTQHDAFKAEYESNHRSVYLMTQRLQRHRFLSLFDGPDTNTTTDVRTESTVPAQSLYLMNNAWLRRQASCLAQQVPRTMSDDSGSLDFLYTAILRRACHAEERDRWLQVLGEMREAADQGSEEASRVAAWTSVAHVLFCSNEFLYVD